MTHDTTHDQEAVAVAPPDPQGVGAQEDDGAVSFEEEPSQSDADDGDPDFPTEGQ